MWVCWFVESVNYSGPRRGYVVCCGGCCGGAQVVVVIVARVGEVPGRDPIQAMRLLLQDRSLNRLPSTLGMSGGGLLVWRMKSMPATPSLQAQQRCHPEHWECLGPPVLLLGMQSMLALYSSHCTEYSSSHNRDVTREMSHQRSHNSSSHRRA